MFSSFMLNTWVAGTAVAVIAGVAGFFAVLRGSTFAAHAIPNGAFAGAAGATLLGLNPFAGLAVFSLAGALGIAGLSRRARNDVATALTFVLTPSTVPVLITSALIALATVVMLARVPLLTSLSPDLAAARGVPVRAVGAAYLMALAVAVSLSAVIIGAVLSTALLIGPAATALRVAKGPVQAAAVAAAIGVAATWLGILLAYDSYYWPPAGRGWPVSFFVVTLVVGGYLVSYLRRPAVPAEPAPDAEHACSAL